MGIHFQSECPLAVVHCFLSHSKMRPGKSPLGRIFLFCSDLLVPIVKLLVGDSSSLALCEPLLILFAVSLKYRIICLLLCPLLESACLTAALLPFRNRPPQYSALTRPQFLRLRMEYREWVLLRGEETKPSTAVAAEGVPSNQERSHNKRSGAYPHEWNFLRGCRYTGQRWTDQQIRYELWVSATAVRGE